eukprot:scaffold6868_cov146-Skeletonema_dohrnii-CCMP3373.AAC.13
MLSTSTDEAVVGGASANQNLYDLLFFFDCIWSGSNLCTTMDGLAVWVATIGTECMQHNPPPPPPPPAKKGSIFHWKLCRARPNFFMKLSESEAFSSRGRSEGNFGNDM